MSQRSEIDSLSPALQTIPLPPREVSLSAQLYLRLSSVSSMPPVICWFCAGFGFMFALIAVGFMGLDDTIPRNWNDAGKAKITSVEETNVSISSGAKRRGHGCDRPIYAYHFETIVPAEAEKVIGVSYGFGGKYAIGVVAPLQKAEQRYRLQGLSLTKVPSEWWWFPLIFLGAGCVFGIGGLCFPIYSWFAGGKAVRLLQYGIAAGAEYLDMNPTSRYDNNPLMKVDFEFQVAGEKYVTSAYALNTSRLTDAEHKIVFYDPMLPKRSVVLDGLPSGIHFDEFSGRFWSSPLRCLLPLLAAAIVCGQIVAIVILALQAI